jgi:hypothetical protein
MCKALRGGLRRGTVTEVTGESASGTKNVSYAAFLLWVLVHRFGVELCVLKIKNR